jgi:hypothetical protein
MSTLNTMRGWWLHFFVLNLLHPCWFRTVVKCLYIHTSNWFPVLKPGRPFTSYYLAENIDLTRRSGNPLYGDRDVPVITERWIILPIESQACWKYPTRDIGNKWSLINSNRWELIVGWFKALWAFIWNFSSNPLLKSIRQGCVLVVFPTQGPIILGRTSDLQICRRLAGVCGSRKFQRRRAREKLQWGESMAIPHVPVYEPNTSGKRLHWHTRYTWNDPQARASNLSGSGRFPNPRGLLDRFPMLNICVVLGGTCAQVTRVHWLDTGT